MAERLAPALACGWLAPALACGWLALALACTRASLRLARVAARGGASLRLMFWHVRMILCHPEVFAY